MLWLGGVPPEREEVAPQRDYRRHLGSEYELVVLDAHGGLDVDALAAVAGTLRGGGLLVLLTPPLAEWPSSADAEFARFAATAARPGGRFIGRLIDCLEDPAVALLEQSGAWHPPAAPVEAQRALQSDTDATRQGAVVEAVLALARAHYRQRPLVLSAPRGRGKSAALGLAAAQLAGQRILVTGPGRGACETLLRHARSDGAAAPRFIPPDELLRQRPAADLLLVDEAAGLPLARLEQLVQLWPRVALATTVHGYEGTGRGFELKFFPRLDRVTPGWQLLRLEAPIRWALGDPLEAWLERVLLLDADPPPTDCLPVPRPSTCEHDCISPDRLRADETLLRQLFGLLVSAHYRTRPSDLRQLLDLPGLQIHVLRQADSVVAAALVVPEGPLPESRIPAILAGRRRVRGQLIPQSLVAHAGCEAAGRLHGLRIMRIAVQPQYQGRGLGSRLLQAVAERVRAAGGIDWFGASFGLDTALLSFWHANGYVPVRIGLRREASSGLHAGVMLQAVTDAGRELLVQLSGRFRELLPLQLSDGLYDLEAELADALLAAHGGAVLEPGELEVQDWRELVALAWGRRGYEVSLVAIRRLLRVCESDWMHSGMLETAERAFLIEKCLQHRPWRQLVEAHGLDGDRAARERLRGILRRLLRVVAPERVAAERERLF